MELTRIAGGDCGRDDCPTIFTTDNDTIAVQGYLMHKETPAGEDEQAATALLDILAEWLG
ncbi:MAG: hypothetical protein ACRDQV_13310 [Pseudonocardiaceae bacterium]